MLPGWQIRVVNKSLRVIVSPGRRDLGRAEVPVSQVEFGDEDRLDVQDRHVVNEHFGLLLVEHHGFHVEARTLDEQPRDVPAVGRLGRDLTRVGEFSHFGVDGEFVEFVLVFLAVLLRECDHVGVRDLDAGQPGADRLAVFDPVVLLLDAEDELVDPRGEFLVGERRQRLPALGDEAVEDVFVDDFELGGHGDEACNHV